jgi:hypothetical protein
MIYSVLLAGFGSEHITATGSQDFMSETVPHTVALIFKQFAVRAGLTLFTFGYIVYIHDFSSFIKL